MLSTPQIQSINRSSRMLLLTLPTNRVVTIVEKEAKVVAIVAVAAAAVVVVVAVVAVAVAVVAVAVAVVVAFFMQLMEMLPLKMKGKEIVVHRRATRRGSTAQSTRVQRS